MENIIGIILVGFMIALVGWGVSALLDNQCADQAAMVGREWHSSMRDGCLVKIDDGQWMPIEGLKRYAK